MRRGGTMAEPCLLPAGGSGELAMARHGKSHQPTAAMLGLFGAAGRARRVCLAAPQATRTACHVFPVLALPPAAFSFKAQLHAGTTQSAQGSVRCGAVQQRLHRRSRLPASESEFYLLHTVVLNMKQKVLQYPDARA